MTLILDYSFSRPSPAAIKAAGYTGVMRYLSTTPGTKPNPKDLSVVEAAALHTAGLSIGLVWETTATRTNQGKAAGATDAANAEAEASALGYPATAVIFYAVDFDAAPSAVAAYFAGVVSKARRPVGVYGSARVVEGITVPYKWQSVAWSGGRVSAKAHLYQRLHATVAHPIGGTDENLVLHPFPMWAPSTTSQAADAIPAIFTTPTTPAQGVDMPLTDAEMNTIADLTVHKLLVAKLGSTGPNVAVALQTASGVGVAAIAAAVLAALPPGTAGFTVEQLAKAVNDDAAARLAK